MKTPAYIIHMQKFRDNCREFTDEFSARWKGRFSLAYSVKTNSDKVLLADFLKFGQYAEVVSEKEYVLAKETGYTDSRIICNGPVKTVQMLKAVENGAVVNFDSVEEAAHFCQLYEKHTEKENFRIGLRVNLDISNVLREEGIDEGHAYSRFGISYENGDLEKTIELLNRHGFCVRG